MSGIQIPGAKAGQNIMEYCLKSDDQLFVL